MLFNSIEYLFFLPIIFGVYWLLQKRSLRLQNTSLLIASYFFYGWWDWRFLFLIVFSSGLNFFLGLLIEKEENSNYQKIFLSISIVFSLGLLFTFKYFNFFIDSFNNLLSALGSISSVSTLNLILPIGISFYTFQMLSYTIDIYRRKIRATNDVVGFFTFVSFFPQLVAGPIERAHNLLPQFFVRRKFSYLEAVDGLRQILWGLFKKVVVADNAAVYVNRIFDNYTDHSGSTLTIAIILFSFQIYGDFSGYSDIAIGTSRLFGIRLMRNFAFPYFSRDIAEFWRKWHISLSTWFRDYLYIPMGGSRVGPVRAIVNIFILFTISGLWHGANWTYVIWGILNAIYFIPLFLRKTNRKHIEREDKFRYFPDLLTLKQMGITFGLTSFAWIFFRAPDLSTAVGYIGRILSLDLLTMPTRGNAVECIVFIVIMIIVEWLQRDKQHGLEFIENNFTPFTRTGIYMLMVLVIISYGGQQENFIYFQF
jgi:alginate O-acetyltransferase complex protein AlgI